MDAKSSQWIVMGPASTPEQIALDEMRKLLNDSPTTWAWTNLSFVAPRQGVSEVDVILLHRTGLYVIELKSYHGTISGDQQNWRRTMPNGRIDAERNPRFSTRFKAQKLASLLREGYRGNVPFIREIVGGRSSTRRMRSHRPTPRTSGLRRSRPWSWRWRTVAKTSQSSWPGTRGPCRHSWHRTKAWSRASRR